MAKKGPGDGSVLEPMRGANFVWRGVFGIDHDGSRWDVAVDFFDWNERVFLYRDGRQDRWERSPARFALDDGAHIEVALSTYGLKRAHLGRSDGSAHQLEPAAGTAERWRADLQRNHPRPSAVLSIASWSVLVVALVLELPQWAQLIAERTDWYAFTSPIDLPFWLNVGMTVAGIIAGLERALLLRYNPLIDE